jgi:hypothetical protein
MVQGWYGYTELAGASGHLWSIDQETGIVSPTQTLGSSLALGWTDAGCDGRALLFLLPPEPRGVVQGPDGGYLIRPDAVTSVRHMIRSETEVADGGCHTFTGPVGPYRTVALEELQPITDTKPADFVGPLHVEF